MKTVNGKNYYNVGFLFGEIEEYPISKFIVYEGSPVEIIEHRKQAPLDSIICKVDELNYLDIPVIGKKQID